MNGGGGQVELRRHDLPARPRRFGSTKSELFKAWFGPQRTDGHRRPVSSSCPLAVRLTGYEGSSDPCSFGAFTVSSRNQPSFCSAIDPIATARSSAQQVADLVDDSLRSGQELARLDRAEIGKVGCIATIYDSRVEDVEILRRCRARRWCVARVVQSTQQVERF